MTFTVDIHHHMLPDFFSRATNEGGRPVVFVHPNPSPDPSAHALGRRRSSSRG